MDVLENTYIVMIADHGEMLGDPHCWQKAQAYEGSARVPMIMRFPPDAPYNRGQVIDQPVGLGDIVPTVLEMIGLDVPDTVEGRSLLALARDPDRDDWRTHYHGEHASIGPEAKANAHQYLVTDRHKYIWDPVTGDELFFDLRRDPGETTDLSTDDDYADRLKTFRDRMVAELVNRDEEFTCDGDLHAKDRPYNCSWKARRDSTPGNPNPTDRLVRSGPNPAALCLGDPE